jgi:hypothetical protein
MGVFGELERVVVRTERLGIVVCIVCCIFETYEACIFD